MSQREITPLIPREVLFGNPDRTSIQLSPDGATIAYLAPVDGVLNVWVGPADDPARVKPVPRIPAAASAFTAGPTQTTASCTSRTRTVMRTGTSTASI